MRPRRPASSTFPTVFLVCASFLVCALLPACVPAPHGVTPDAIQPNAAQPDAAQPDRQPDWQLDWARDAVFYEVFVRSFADSDGDGVGDFRGLTARLDHLNDGDPATGDDLGVDALWLMPVFESPSYHGYDAVDYRTVDGEYGTAEDFATFLEEAHRRGIRVIVDLMINHTSSQHPWFEVARTGPDSPLRDWYVWRDDDPGWTQPWGSSPTWHRNPADGTYYYGIFWGGMPDLNFRNPEVRAAVKGIAGHWLELGVDGFRLDAARHIVATGPGDGQNGSPETHAWWREFAEHVHAIDPSALLVGEVWSDAADIAPYFAELPMNFNFPLAGGVVEAVKSGSAAPVASALAAMDATYPDHALPAHFLTNHDMVRIASQVDGDPARLRAAAALLLTLPGTPFLYYGEEVGLRNGPGGADEWKRTPMPWTAGDAVESGAGGGFTDGEPWHPFAPGRETANVAAQRGAPGSLLSRYRTLIRLRRGSPALSRGSWRVLAGDAVSTDGSPVLALERRADGERVLVGHHLGFGGDAAAVTLEALEGLEMGKAEPLWADAGARLEAPADGGGSWHLSLPPGASGVWRLR